MLKPAQEANPLIHIDQLQAGMFVSLDLSWMDHPFLTNSFLIKDEKQLATLREMGLRMISFDPARSTTQALPLESEPTTPEIPKTNGENQLLMDEKRARGGRMTMHRDHIQKCEKSYVESVASVKNVLSDILRNPGLAVKNANRISSELVSTFTDDRGATILMATGLKADEITYQHSLNVMILTMILCKGLNVKREIMEAAGVGALMHDVGKSNMSQTVLRNTQRNRVEENLYRKHCEFGSDLVGSFLMPGVRAAIEQHHENFDGSGFPKGLQGNQINLIARAVAIANRYDNLCNPIKIIDAMSPAEAVSSMYSRESKRFDMAMLAVFIKELGVYPPGSFVTLSNGSLAMVISATPGQSLKPTVMVYEPGIPRKDALVVNLVESLDVRIENVIKPSSLELDVLTYLNPRMRLSYHAEKKV